MPSSRAIPIQIAVAHMIARRAIVKELQPRYIVGPFGSVTLVIGPKTFPILGAQVVDGKVMIGGDELVVSVEMDANTKALHVQVDVVQEGDESSRVHKSELQAWLNEELDDVLGQMGRLGLDDCPEQTAPRLSPSPPTWVENFTPDIPNFSAPGRFSHLPSRASYAPTAPTWKP